MNTSYFNAIMSGLGSTLLISIISLAIGGILGSFLFVGRKSRIGVIRILCTGYIELFEGIPVLAQLFFVYYVMPLMCSINIQPETAAVVVLALNAIAGIASISKSFTDIRGYCFEASYILKVITLSLIKVFGKLIKYTTLLSIIGMEELLRTSTYIMSLDGKYIFIIVSIAIYLVLHIILKITYNIILKLFFRDVYETTHQSGEHAPLILNKN